MTLEIDGKSSIAGLTIVQQEVANSLGAISSSQIVFDPVKGPLSLGEPKQLDYRLNGRFPIGTNSGKIRVSSPQLSAPVIVNFEVLSRRSYFLIPILLFLGFVVGFLTKHTFKNWKQKKEARASALKLLRKISEHQIKKDIAFLSSIESELNKLRRLVDERDPNLIVKGVKTISESFQEAVNDLEERRKTATRDHRFLIKIVESSPLMPPNVNDSLDGFTEKVADAESFLKTEDYSTGQEKLDLARKKLKANIKDPINKWFGWQQLVLDELKSDPIAFSSALAGQLDDGIEQVGEKLDKALFLESLDEPTAEQLWKGLRSVHQAYFAMRGFLRYTASRIVDVREDVIGTLRDSGAPINETKINYLIRQIERLVSALEPEKAIGENSSNEISKAKRRLFSAWKQAISVGDNSTWSPDDIDDFNSKLEGGEYVSAAQIAAENHAKDPQFEAAVPKVMRAIEPKSSLSDASGNMYNADSVIIQTKSLQDLIAADPITHGEFFSAEKAKLETQDLWMSLLQFSVVALGLGFVGYFLMVDNFIGTGKELLFIFMWGFGLDLSIDDLLKKGAGLGR